MIALEPVYMEEFGELPTSLDRLVVEVPWVAMTETRLECFMAPVPEITYTYGRGLGERTYTAGPFAAGVDRLLLLVNERLHLHGWGPCNVAFLNRYDGSRQYLGWHSDKHAGTNHDRPIAVVSFGQARKIQWRETPVWVRTEIHTQLLADRSLFVMPPHFQDENDHQIPKGGCVMKPRISITFRAFKGVPEVGA